MISTEQDQLILLMHVQITDTTDWVRMKLKILNETFGQEWSDTKRKISNG